MTKSPVCDLKKTTTNISKAIISYKSQNFLKVSKINRKINNLINNMINNKNNLVLKNQRNTDWSTLWPDATSNT